MMVAKIYALVWLLVVGTGGLLYFTVGLNEMTLAIFGFVVSTLLAAGVVIVLPWLVDRKYTWNYKAG